MVNNIYKNKKVIVTGHTGFKGSWLTIWLHKLGAKVCGYSLKPNTKPSMFEELNIEKICNNVYGDILDIKTLEKAFCEFQPEIVFHLAAQPLVRRSYYEPKLTYETNIIGTLNVLEIARKTSSVKAFVNITTDKCYENKETLEGYKESDAFGGYDMYSSSKACVEILSSSYRRSFLQNSTSYLLSTVRAGNVIGGGDWAEDRLVPDCIKAINNNKPIEIRNPIAVRPWQHVLEPLSAYLKLGEKLLLGDKDFAQGFNIGPNETSVMKVQDVAKKICEIYGQGEVFVGEKSELHEANLLMLNIDKIKKELDWTPTYSVEKAIELTVDWYKNYYKKENNMLEFTLQQINEFEKEQNLCV